MKKCNAESDEEHHAFYEELLKTCVTKEQQFLLMAKTLVDRSTRKTKLVTIEAKNAAARHCIHRNTY